MDPRFYDRAEHKACRLPIGHTPVVDPRFYKEKARNSIRASVISEPLVSETGLQILEKGENIITPHRPVNEEQKKKLIVPIIREPENMEEPDAHDIDV